MGVILGMMKFIKVAALAACLAPAPAIACPFVLTVSDLEPSNFVAFSKLIGSTIYSSTNEDVGTINDVILSKDGKIQVIVIGLGGFLGLGQKDIAVPLDRIEFARDGRITISASRQELLQAPSFDLTKWRLGR